MPLNTQIIRDGEAVKLEGGWGWAHACAIFHAAMLEHDPTASFWEDGKTIKDVTEEGHICDALTIIYAGNPPPLVSGGNGEQVLKEDHDLGQLYEDEGPFVLRAGDKLRAWR